MGTEITISIPDELYRLAEEIATRRNRSISEVLAESIYLTDSEFNGDDEGQDEAVEREKASYIAMHPLLLQKYPGEHVAIYQGRLIDHDKDGIALHRRIYARFPDEFVWITQVKEKPIQELVFRSPRLG